MKRYHKIILGLFMLSVFILGSLYMPESFSLAGLIVYKSLIIEYYNAHPVLFVSGFILAYIISTAFALPTGAVLTLAGGFIMGTLTATISVVIGATIGAILLFLAARTTIGAPLQAKVQKYAPKFKANMEGNAIEYLLFLRLVPIFPFFAVNILPSLFNIPLKTFALTTLIGIIPGTAAYCYFGSTLSTLSSTSDIVSLNVLLALSFLGALALVPTFLKKRKKKHAQV